MKRPIIGIIGKVQPQYGEDIWHRIDEVDEIRYLIVKNGGTAIMLLPTEITLKFNDNDIKKEKYNVNSIHSMIAPKGNVEKYARISAISYDNLVESFELDNKKFVMGIKWHPELMLEDEFSDKLFKKFISKC